MKFNSHDQFFINKAKGIPTITIVVRAVCHKKNKKQNKYYPHVF